MSSDFITEEAMSQYKAIKRSELCNMFDYKHVITKAGQLGLYNLASLNMEQYGKLLMNAEERKVKKTELLIKRSIPNRRFKC